MNKFYYVDSSGNVQGPLTVDQLRSLHRSGVVSATTQVCVDGKDEWQPLYEIQEFKPQQTKKSHPVPEKAKTTFEGTPSSQHQMKNQQEGVTRTQGKILIVLILIGMGAPFLVFLKPTPKWEYQTLQVFAETQDNIFDENLKKLSYKTIPDISNKINSLGTSGWELVTVYLEHETAHPNFGKEDFVTGIQPNVRPQTLVCIFKRQKRF